MMFRGFLIAALLLMSVGCAMTRTMPDGSVVVVEVDGQEAAALLDRIERWQERRDAAVAAGEAERAERLDRRIAEALALLETVK
jgi:hypothetical protein